PSVLPQTFRRIAGKQLLKFLRQSHSKMMQESAFYTRKAGFQRAGHMTAESRHSLTTSLSILLRSSRYDVPGHSKARPPPMQDPVLSHRCEFSLCGSPAAAVAQ